MAGIAVSANLPGCSVAPRESGRTMCARPPRRATRSCRITPTHEPKSVRIFAGAVATAHWPIATETVADDPDVPEEPEAGTTHTSRSVSFEFAQRGCQRVKRCTIGNEQ